MTSGGAAPGGQHVLAETLPHPSVSSGQANDPELRRGIDIKVALIGAAATIVAALIAGAVAIKTGTIEVSTSDQASDNDQLRVTVTSLEREKELLASENKKLQDRLDEQGSQPHDPTDSTSVTSGTAAQTSTVRRATAGTPLTFTWTYSADLDSQDADWAVLQGSETGWDLYLDGDGSVTTHEVTIVDHVPTEAECRDSTVRQPSLGDEQSREGVMMCVRTTEDRFAFVRIAGIDEERKTTSVDIVVWE